MPSSLGIPFLIFIPQKISASANSRQKRDTTCAWGGRTACNYSCKARGWADGDCAWNTETGAFNCECSKQRRGIR